MKLRLLFLSLSIVASFLSKATTITINANEMTFSPADVTLTLGDTVKFVYITGSNHTTTSASIPAGAATWDAPLTSVNPTYIYVPTVAGTYNYVCTPHIAMGMIGKFTVTGTTNISDISLAKTVFDAYPNPATGILNISFKNDKENIMVSVMDISGRQLIRENNINTASIQLDVSGLTPGFYLIRVHQDGKTFVRKFSVVR